MNKKHIISYLLLLSLIFTGCSSQSDRSSNHKSNDLTKETVAYVDDYESFDYDYSNGVTSDAVEFEAEYSTSTPNFSPDTPDVQAQSPDRMLIRTITLQAETENFDAADSLIRANVSAYGGYFDNSNVHGTGKNYDYRTGTYTIRVPESTLDALVESLSGTCTVTGRSDTTTDVTLQYIDTQSQLDSLRAEQEALTNMLSEADNLDNIIILQSELTSVRYQIQSLESQLRAMSNQVAYSTLTITINEVVEEVEEVETRTETFGDKANKTWKDSLKDLKNLFLEFILWIVSIGPVLCIIVPIIIIAIIVIKIKIKKFKKKKTSKNATNEEKIQPVVESEQKKESDSNE